jgi:hypothetical protein
VNPRCVNTVIAGERLLRNGAFHTQGLRNVRFTGPYLHNGSKMTLRQVVDFYKTAGHFPTLNLNNMDAGMRLFALGAADDASLVEFLETGLTDWDVMFERGKFDHPQLCVPNGHDASGQTTLIDVPAVGRTGNAQPLVTFETVLRNGTGAHDLKSGCTIGGLSIK